MPEETTNDVQSVDSARSRPARRMVSGWIRVGAVATASAVAGGLAAAWFYRKTLRKLQEAESEAGNPDLSIPHRDTGEDI